MSANEQQDPQVQKQDRKSMPEMLRADNLPDHFQVMVEEGLDELFNPPGARAKTTIKKEAVEAMFDDTDIWKRMKNKAVAALDVGGDLKIGGVIAGIAIHPASLKKAIAVRVEVHNTPQNAALMSQFSENVNIVGTRFDDQGDIERGHVGDAPEESGEENPDQPELNLDSEDGAGDSGFGDAGETEAAKTETPWYLDTELVEGEVFGNKKVIDLSDDNIIHLFCVGQGYSAKLESVKSKENPWPKKSHPECQSEWARGWRMVPKSLEWWIDLKCPSSPVSMGSYAYINGCELNDNPFSKRINEIDDAKEDVLTDELESQESEWARGHTLESEAAASAQDQQDGALDGAANSKATN